MKTLLFRASCALVMAVLLYNIGYVRGKIDAYNEVDAILTNIGYTKACPWGPHGKN